MGRSCSNCSGGKPSASASADAAVTSSGFESKQCFTPTYYREPPPIRTASPRPWSRSPHFVAKYNYNAPAIGDLAFRAGDVLEIEGRCDPDCWQALLLRTGLRGNVPSTYLKPKLSGNLEMCNWYCGSPLRRYAEEMLLLPQNGVGSFLVRESETYPTDLVISLRLEADSIYHVRIRPLCDRGGCYVLKKSVFISVAALVEYYMSHPMYFRGTAYTLGQPCYGLAEMQQKKAQGHPLCVAKYDYDDELEGDLAFKKGDVLEIVDHSHKDWWQAISERTGLRGNVPSNYVGPKFGADLEAHDWFFGDLPKEDVEEMLLMPQNGIGSFLVSENGRLPGELTLSMRCTSRTSSIKHYRIQAQGRGGCYIGRGRPFSTVSRLIDHCKQQAYGLACRLDQPCYRVEQPPLTSILPVAGETCPKTCGEDTHKVEQDEVKGGSEVLTEKSEILKKEVHGILPRLFTFFKLHNPLSSLRKIGSLAHHLQSSLREEQKKRAKRSARKPELHTAVGRRPKKNFRILRKLSCCRCCGACSNDYGDVEIGRAKVFTSSAKKLQT